MDSKGLDLLIAFVRCNDNDVVVRLVVRKRIDHSFDYMKSDDGIFRVRYNIDILSLSLM